MESREKQNKVWEALGDWGLSWVMSIRSSWLWTETEGSQTVSGDWRESLGIVTGQNLDFLCPKLSKKYGDRVWRKYKVALTLNWQRGGGTQLAYASRTVHPHPNPLHPTMRSLGAYTRWGLAVRSRWWGTKVIGSWFLSLVLFQRQSEPGVSNQVIESGSLEALWPSF